MAQGVRVTFEALRSSAFGSIGAGYTIIGTAFTSPTRIMTITNLTDVTLLFSFDNGVTDHDVLPAGAGKVYDFTANTSVSAGTPFFETGGSVYVKRASGAPTLGAVYVSVEYCQGD